jgi:hypothetical protein
MQILSDAKQHGLHMISDIRFLFFGNHTNSVLNVNCRLCMYVKLSSLLVSLIYIKSKIEIQNLGFFTVRMLMSSIR